MYSNAEYAALTSLRMTLKSQMNFQRMCYAYSDAISTGLHNGRTQFTIGLEIEALRMCLKKTTDVDMNELEAVVKMYTSIFHARYVNISC